MEKFIEPKKLSKKTKKELDKKNRVWYDLPNGGLHKTKKDYDRKEIKKDLRKVLTSAE